MSPAATVLVATHSHGPLIGPAVRSALGQTVRDLDVLIVGDGPTPETAACASALADSDERVRYPRQPTRSTSLPRTCPCSSRSWAAAASSSG